MAIRINSPAFNLASTSRPPGFYLTGQYLPGKTIMEYDSTTYATASAAFVDLKIWTNVTGYTAGSKLELYYHVPCRNDGAGWGGAYIEPNISFDGGTTYYSLGHGGFDGGCMNIGGDDIHYQNNLIWIDPNQASAYQLRMKFRYAVYDQTVTVNGSHDINGADAGYNSNYLTTNNSHLQHFMHYILREWIPVA